ncbi:orf50-like protein [Peridroma alphabaculovirus]|uniref:Orf50-like protein n=1 Tax=Peridroma alphabaculovirus TaxID=1346829 RepID=A0A068LMS9_9ABAC|nr:orf50-like protein [Peridroma alphabaculovirus]AIE47831.1 orf50-like protein [Peridroma alphabaculovirus]
MASHDKNMEYVNAIIEHLENRGLFLDDTYSTPLYPFSPLTHKMAQDICDGVGAELLRCARLVRLDLSSHLEREFASDIVAAKTLPVSEIVERVVGMINAMAPEVTRRAAKVEKMKDFVQKSTDYVLSDLDLPFYKGKDFYRDASYRKTALLQNILTNEDMLEWLRVEDADEQFQAFASTKLDAINNMLETEWHRYPDWEEDVYSALEDYINETPC